jgi:protein subunit release factor A
MKKYLVEVKPAEGGKDSELFVDDLINAYQKTFDKLG